MIIYVRNNTKLLQKYLDCSLNFLKSIHINKLNVILKTNFVWVQLGGQVENCLHMLQWGFSVVL